MIFHNYFKHKLYDQCDSSVVTCNCITIRQLYKTFDYFYLGLKPKRGYTVCLFCNCATDIAIYVICGLFLICHVRIKLHFISTFDHGSLTLLPRDTDRREQTTGPKCQEILKNLKIIIELHHYYNWFGISMENAFK